MRFPTRTASLLSFAALSALMFATASCAMSEPDSAGDTATQVASSATLVEGFENASKSSYAAANVTLGSGAWNLSDALIGSLSTDVFDGTQAARMRNSGTITMQFDRTTGAGTVTIRHATYGSDANGTWALFASQNGGSTWTQVGSSRSTTPSSLSTATFTVNLAGTIRFQIRKTDGGTNRINIDDISITDFTSTGGGGGGTGGGTSGAALSIHTTMGIPAPVSTTTPNAFLSLKHDYTLSYNGSRRVPNWVSWELNTTWEGAQGRANDFRIDDTFPASEPQAQLADYSGSGFDRGHMCPSADRTDNLIDNENTFYLTNMVPQAANNNRGPWVGLEDELRTIASGGKELFIVAGGTFSAGSSTIGADAVVVPDSTWKVAVVLDAVGQGAKDVTTNTRVISVIMPNRDTEISLTAPWQNFRVSLDAVQAATGLDLLSDIDPTVKAAIETRVDNQ